jgi:hypothetical protein
VEKIKRNSQEMSLLPGVVVYAWKPVSGQTAAFPMIREA